MRVFWRALSSNISQYIDFNIGTQASYNNVKNSMNTGRDNSFYNQSSRLDLNYLTQLGLFFNTQLNHQFYSGLGDEFNQNYLLWNAAIGYKFLKKKEAEIKFSVYDLLNQNQAINRVYNDIYTQDSRTNVLGQYFMLTFTYTLRQFTGKSSEEDFKNNKGGDFKGAPKWH